MAGKPGRSGPRPGNLNGLKNGSKLSRRRLTVGELPKQLLSVRREGRAYRRALEAEVLAVKGAIGLTDSHLIDTASAATIQAGICRWLLRQKIGTMSTAEIRGCTQDIVRAKERRDAAVKALGLDVPPEPIDLGTYLENHDGAGGTDK
jgi:hypothetical protein